MKKISIEVASNEEKILPIIWVNQKEKELALEVRLTARGARVHIIGIFLGIDTNAFTFTTSVIHLAPQTKSRTTIKGVFKNNAVFSNNGLISIQKGAKGADGYFISRILLFDSAKGRSVPSLEIDENDLKAGHASTIGRPEAEQLFYLRSRGLSEEESARLIVSGFFEPVLSLLALPDQKKARKKLSPFIRLQ